MLPNNKQLTPVRAERTWVTPQPALRWGGCRGAPRAGRDTQTRPAADRGAVRAGTHAGKGRSHLGCPDPAIRAFPEPRQAPPEGRSAPGCRRPPRRCSAGTPLRLPPRGAAQRQNPAPLQPPCPPERGTSPPGLRGTPGRSAGAPPPAPHRPGPAPHRPALPAATHRSRAGGSSPSPGRAPPAAAPQPCPPPAARD